METNKNLFERLGGMDTINTIVDIFYTKVLADESINHFFTNTKIKKVKAKQKTFLATAFGAPTSISNAAEQNEYSKLALTETYFEAVLDHLAYSLEELNVPGSQIDEALSILQESKSDFPNP